MSIADLKSRLHDVPDIGTLSMQMIAGRQVYSIGSNIVASARRIFGQDSPQLMFAALCGANGVAFATAHAETAFSALVADFYRK
jgi:hypothetical protein